MILWFRFFITILRGLIKGKIHPLDPYTRSFRSIPFWDSELQFLNGARYFSFCELCVNEVNVRSGYFKVFLKHKIIGATSNKTSHFIRPIKNLRKFDVSTQLLGWDEKFFYRSFQFHQEGILKFEALYKIATTGKNKPTPQDALKKMGYPNLKSPDLPEKVKFLDFRAS